MVDEFGSFEMLFLSFLSNWFLIRLTHGESVIAIS